MLQEMYDRIGVSVEPAGQLMQRKQINIDVCLCADEVGRWKTLY